MKPVLAAMLVGFSLGWSACAARAADLATSTSPDTAYSEAPLLFPKAKFTLRTVTVRTSKGQKKVAYRLYQHIPYVARPIDKDYQSLDVEVPIQVDGVVVDASKAPILLNIGVGGYMSVNNMRGGRGGPPGMGPGEPGGPGGPPDMGPGGPPPGMGPGWPGGPPGANSKVSGKTDLCLAAGYVVVSPGCRGRDNKAGDGTYFGKAPAAIVDLKAAVRYIRNNAGVMPGNSNWIVSTGVSAGGALSALLGASGDSHAYDGYLKEIGAADASDAIFASADFCPITDLQHADAAYEWMFGAVPVGSGLVDQGFSQTLKDQFASYQASLALQGRADFGTITADNYGRYLLQDYLCPSANVYLASLSPAKRREYLQENSWIKWSGNAATFEFSDYLAHIGRMKGLPAFDDFEMRKPETIEFGNRTTNARHFTDFSLQRSTGNPNAKIGEDLQSMVDLMNPMYFIVKGNLGCAKHWWIRHGSSDRDTSLPIVVNLATSLENQKKDVNVRLYWDAGHGTDLDPEDFVAWVAKITGYKNHS